MSAVRRAFRAKVAFAFSSVTCRFYRLRLGKTGVLTPIARCVRNYKLRLRFTHLGKGDAALSRCIPLAADTSITPCLPRSALQIAAGVECVSATYGRCITSQGAFLLPNTP